MDIYGIYAVFYFQMQKVKSVYYQLVTNLWFIYGSKSSVLTST